MNERQRRILLAGALVLLLSCLFVPWYAEDDGGFLDFGYAWFFSEPAVYLDIHRLVVEWVAILAATAAGFFLSNEPPRGPEQGRGAAAADRRADLP